MGTNLIWTSCQLKYEVKLWKPEESSSSVTQLRKWSKDSEKTQRRSRSMELTKRVVQVTIWWLCLLLVRLHFSQCNLYLHDYPTEPVFFVDSRGEGTPVFQCLMESENKALFSVALSVFQSLAPDVCSEVRCILSDTSCTFINAWRETINVDVIWSVCHWHLEKSWSKHIKNPEMYREVKNLRYISSEAEFMVELEKLKK